MDKMLERVEADALRMMTYGAYVLGAGHGDEVAAATVAWVTQASLVSPPTVVACIRKHSHTHDLALRSGAFSVNMLALHQTEMARAFLHPTRVEEGHLNGYAYRTEHAGAPILEDAPAWIEAEVRHVEDADDHAVLIARVTNAGVASFLADRPLTLRDMGLTYAGTRGAYATGKEESAWVLH